MAKPLQEKLKIARFIPSNARSVLDAGCADGAVTVALADLFPQIEFLGVDLSKDFIQLAKQKIEGRTNVKFESGYLRERLAKPERFDAVIFCSVLHEFFTYGEGISTVVKALADAHEILKPKGRLIIRDMILYDYTKTADIWPMAVLEKVLAKAELEPQIKDFENRFGKINTLARINHFLLKYLYRTPVSFEEYAQILELLGMKIQYCHSYLIPYLEEQWIKDFNFTEGEITSLRSTGIIVAEKIIRRY